MWTRLSVSTQLISFMYNTKIKYTKYYVYGERVCSMWCLQTSHMIQTRELCVMFAYYVDALIDGIYGSVHIVVHEHSSCLDINYFSSNII
jgi:hypothetical protein